MSFFGRSCIVVLIAAALLAPIIGWGALHTLSIEIDDSTKWVPPTHQVRRDYEDFTTHFENGDILIISWPGCTIEDERVIRLVAALDDPQRFCNATGKPYFERVASGAHFWRQLSDVVGHSVAITRLKGSVIGSDGQSTAAFITFTKAGVA